MMNHRRSRTSVDSHRYTTTSNTTCLHCNHSFLTMTTTVVAMVAMVAMMAMVAAVTAVVAVVARMVAVMTTMMTTTFLGDRCSFVVITTHDVTSIFRIFFSIILFAT